MMAAHKLLLDIVKDSFFAEINALKPGNVHKFANGHDMLMADFELSAKLTTPILCDQERSMGQRVLDAVTVTMQQVGCNTNLGMILLFTPLILAAEKKTDARFHEQDLQQRLSTILTSLTLADARLVYQAIVRANPGGLGSDDQYDVHDAPEITLFEAMSAAKNRDRIALQYVTDFADIFQLGYQSMRQGMERWNRVDGAVVLCYLNFLSRYCDSHVARKFGDARAETIRKHSEGLAHRFGELDNPEDMHSELMQFDSELKHTGVNPGTTADMTAASVLIYFLVLNEC